MISDWIDHDIEVGDYVRYAAEGLCGEVIAVFHDSFGDPVSCVLEMVDNEGHATLDLSECVPIKAMLH